MTSDLQRGGGLREATRRAVRAQIAAAAVELFAEHGFEQTTVDQIAGAVGMSQRSVFRYFATKEDMVVGELIEESHRVVEALVARPANESPHTALRRALDVCVASLTSDPGVRRGRMLANTPALQIARAQKHRQWVELLRPELARRLGDTARTDLVAGSIITATLSCLEIAGEEWIRHDCAEPLGELFDAALAALRD
ncbi:TetR/AcrR family transcriptional regulator [Kutzneria sp. 744]|uniref:TetR/AcrR family transcriptional regulator n=1 Tax=Kutzneria sp. (strain 744) TaxID=345341 RepID=UPI0003EED8FF|nr:TetR/AcrR family transcriptional regulator [Kutzneria sp. 744]EWM11888.1 TetR-family transcriptional regulator [Kutzneria sp. 744]